MVKSKKKFEQIRGKEKKKKKKKESGAYMQLHVRDGMTCFGNMTQRRDK